MAFKIFLIFVTVLAYVELLQAAPSRRQLISITESAVSESPVTSDGTVWDDNDEFDLDGDQDDWFSRAVVSPSVAPEKASEYGEYDDDYTHENSVVDFADDDDDEEGQEEQEAEEEMDVNNNDSKFLFLPPRDTRLMLDDDDDDQSGPIKVRHTGKNSYPRIFDGSDNSLESSEEEHEEVKDEDNEHPYEFTIDEDDKEEDDDDDDEDSHKEDDNVETFSRHDAQEDDDEDDFVSEGEDGDMFDNPEEDAAHVIYGDHVFLY